MMKNNNNTENKNNFKNVKTTCRRIIRQQYRINERNQYENTKENEKTVWRNARKKIFHEKSNDIERLYYNGEFSNGSKKCADTVNKYFYYKIGKLIEQIPKQEDNPMKNYQKSIKQPKTLMQFKEIDMKYNTIQRTLYKGLY